MLLSKHDPSEEWLGGLVGRVIGRRTVLCLFVVVRVLMPKVVAVERKPVDEKEQKMLEGKNEY